MARSGPDRTHPSRRGWWTTGDLAELFGVSPKIAARWLDDGTGGMSFYRTPGSKRRMVAHVVLMRFLRADPQYEALVKRADSMAGA